MRSKFEFIAMTGKLVEKGELDTLKAPELDKYIEHNKLSNNGKKMTKSSNQSTFPSSVSKLPVVYRRLSSL